MVEATIPHVVMVTHSDRLGFLGRTIPALLTTAHPMTLTLVANAPSPSVKGWLNSLKPALYGLVVNGDNRGFAVACNQGWKLRPEAAYCVHLGDDCLALEPDWLRKIVDIAECCPEVGIVGHSVEPLAWPRRLVGKPGNRRMVQVQPSGLGGIILVPERTRAICGYYNEEMGLYGEEDALYGWKVRQAGLLCAYFDHTNLGRSFEHIGQDDSSYRAWKDARRLEAILIRDQLMREYEAGRPLDQ